MDLINAVKNDNVDILKILLAVPESVSHRDIKSATLYSVRNNLTDCLEVLLEKGKLSHEVGNNFGTTLLMQAAEAGHHGIIRQLVNNGTCVNSTSGNGATALLVAARCGYTGAVKELLDASARVDVTDSCECTPLILASKRCHPHTTVMKLLLKAGCDLNKQDKHGRTALHYTCLKAVSVDILLAAGANPDIADYDGNTPIMLAATEGFDSVVTSLCIYNCNTNLTDCNGRLAVHYLAMKNHWEGIDAIGHHGGNVSLPDNQGNIPIWYACHYNRPDAVKALLRANTELEPPVDSVGGVPLQTALELQLFGIAKLLILAGCKVGPLYTWMEQVQERNASREQHQAMLFFHQREEIIEDREEVEAVNWFEDWINTPHTLCQICRIVIRRYLGHCGIRKNEELPLPQSMRDYITLREIEDHPL